MKKVFAVALGLGLFAQSAFAGNPQRGGEAGASELLINPFTRSGGWSDVSVANTVGSESMFMNIAGLAYTSKTEAEFTHTQWLVGAGIGINNFALAQRVGENGVLGLNVVGFDYGEWEVVTEEQPEGTGGTISPSTVNINLGYAQKFTKSITGGVNIKLYSSSISNMSVSGVAFDAGVQYITGDNREWKFGITLKNVGPSISFDGDGNDLTLPSPTNGVAYGKSYSGRSADIELPTQLRLGAAYDWYIDEEQILTFAANFTSNSFQKDQYILGAQYSMKKYLALRVGYTFEDQKVDNDDTNAMGGLTAGLSFDVPLGTNGSKFGFDYAYRTTDAAFAGVHTIGLRFGL